MNKTLLMALALCGGCYHTDWDRAPHEGLGVPLEGPDAAARTDGRAGGGGFGGAGGFGGGGRFDQAVDAAGGAQLDRGVDGVVQADGQVDLALQLDQAVDAGGPQLDQALRVDQAVDAARTGSDRLISPHLPRQGPPECESSADCTDDEVCFQPTNGGASWCRSCCSLTPLHPPRQAPEVCREPLELARMMHCQCT